MRGSLNISGGGLIKATILCQAAILFLTCACHTPTVTAKTWHVPGDAATIQDGINLASANDTVIVACGTYYEYDLKMKSGVCLRSATGDAGCVTIDAQQQDRVFYCRFVTSAARIEGFTITGGFASEGGGLYCLDNSSPSLKNCVISGDSASDWGGGVYCSVNSSPAFVNCAITGNSAESGGGGMYCLENSSPALTDCSISGNSATTGGGMLCYHFCSPTLTNCTISNNWSVYGGGIRVSLNCDATLTDCTFSDNVADSRGGGMGTAFGGSATLTNCTFLNNSAYSGGAVCLASDGSVTFTNCSLIGNSASSDGGGIKIQCNGGCASTTLISCSLTDNSARTGGGIYLEGATYFAADTTEFHNNTASTSGANGYVESEGEVVLTCCVSDLGGFEGDGTITLNNEGCFSPTEPTTWGRLKALYR
ncbi:MAG: right-handed parallel beta-helix repeat-containing protein [Candidatus Latescibacterota bacterium]|nr:MAG: right-handed parallel beta-helix repeat-containing protein [Candidatus Latescibacterota bacterium]